jgi:hypothetical protein
MKHRAAARRLTWIKQCARAAIEARNGRHRDKSFARRPAAQ